MVGDGGNGVLTVAALASSVTDNIDLLVLRATGSGQSVTVTGSAAAEALLIEADNGIAVNQSLTTTVGDLVLNGDSDNSADGVDAISFASGVSLQAARDLSLTANTGKMQAAGPLTLQAKRDILVNSSLTGNSTLTVIADSELDQTGTVRVAAGQVVSSNGLMRIQSADLDLSGSLSNA